MHDIVLLILGAALGLVSQWVFYRYQRRDENRQGPNVVISKVDIQGQPWLELRNVGKDTLSEMDVKMSWQQGGEHREVMVTSFRQSSGEAARHVEVLGIGETLRADAQLSWSDDGVIDVLVTGLGVQSQRLYSAISQITVALPPAQ